MGDFRQFWINPKNFIGTALETFEGTVLLTTPPEEYHWPENDGIFQARERKKKNECKEFIHFIEKRAYDNAIAAMKEHYCPKHEKCEICKFLHVSGEN